MMADMAHTLLRGPSTPRSAVRASPVADHRLIAEHRRHLHVPMPRPNEEDEDRRRGGRRVTAPTARSKPGFVRPDSYTFDLNRCLRASQPFGKTPVSLIQIRSTPRGVE